MHCAPALPERTFQPSKHLAGRRGDRLTFRMESFSNMRLLAGLPFVLGVTGRVLPIAMLKEEDFDASGSEH